MEDTKIFQFKNCYIMRDHKILRDDLWVRNGRIVNPEPIFYEEKKMPDVVYDCDNMLIAPGYIDLQINGGLGFDFSDPEIDMKAALRKIGLELLKHGVTAYCPTLVTQPAESYHRILQKIKRTQGDSENGATILGVHLEGPFISSEKKGAHPQECVKDDKLESLDEVSKMYKHLDDVAIITMAPELDETGNIVRQLVNRGIKVSIGHSIGSLTDGERAINSGANFITHLFNAMLPFHHRDPGLVGLLTSSQVDKQVFYGIIADGIHTHYAALRIAFKSNPAGLVLVTDAVSPTGLQSGVHHIGLKQVEIKDNKAFILGTNTLSGSIATMDFCVRHFMGVTSCSKVEAIECATLHPAQAMGIANRKGTLNFGADADFILLDDQLNVMANFISGNCLWQNTKIKF